MVMLIYPVGIGVTRRPRHPLIERAGVKMKDGIHHGSILSSFQK